MAKPIIGQILDVLDAGGHVMGTRTSYYDAKAIRDGLRAHDYFARARKAAKNYRVRVEPADMGNGKKLVISTFDRSMQISI